MADNKDKKVLNVPALRFPEFTDEWESVLLEDVAEFQKKRISSDLYLDRKYIAEFWWCAKFNLNTSEYQCNRISKGGCLIIEYTTVSKKGLVV